LPEVPHIRQRIDEEFGRRERREIVATVDENAARSAAISASPR